VIVHKLKNIVSYLFTKTLASLLQVIMVIKYSKSNINLSNIQTLKSPTDYKKWKKGTRQWLIKNNFNLDTPVNLGAGPAINQP